MISAARRAVLPTLVTLSIGLSLAGCRSSQPSAGAAAPPAGGASPTAPATTTPAPSTAPNSTAATGPALTTLPAACPTAAEVSSTLGITAPPVNQSKTATTLDCVYAGSSAGNTVSINCTTATKLTPAAAEAALRAQGVSANFQKIPNTGDAAFYDSPPTGGSYIAVLSGTLSFHIVVGGVVAPDKLTALAQSILAG